MSKTQPAYCTFLTLIPGKEADEPKKVSLVVASPASSPPNAKIRLHPALARYAGSQATSLAISQVETCGRNWLIECARQRFSPRTIEFRQHVLHKLAWHLERTGQRQFDAAAIDSFLDYLDESHHDPEGRWGNAQNTKPVKARTAHRYYRELKTFCNWMVEQEILEVSPMLKRKPPKLPKDEMPHFTECHVEGLLQAAALSQHPSRDAAILHLLLDTGLRASELCELQIIDIDIDTLTGKVWHGKGDKARTVVFGYETKKVVWSYLKERCQVDKHSKPSRRARTMERLAACAQSPYLFIADRGREAGQPLSRHGLRHLLRRLGAVAGVPATLCHPHTCRHTFAINYLRNKKGDIKTLSQLLGHESLQMTSRYLALSEFDIAAQWEYSPMDSRKRS